MKRILKIKDKTDSERSIHERYLLNRFGIDNRFDIVGPESTRRGITLDDMTALIDKRVQENSTDTLIHHYQSSSLCIFNYAKEKLPDYQQKTFIIWLDPLRHLHNAVTYRHGDNYKIWSIYHLKERFLHTTRNVLFSLKAAHDQSGDNKAEDIDVESIPEQLKEYDIEVVTPIASRNYETDLHLYSTIDAESLRLILRDAAIKPKKK